MVQLSDRTYIALALCTKYVIAQTQIMKNIIIEIEGITNCLWSPVKNNSMPLSVAPRRPLDRDQVQRISDLITSHEQPTVDNIEINQNDEVAVF